MTEALGSCGVHRFGVFEFDPASGELRKQGMKIKLQGQPIEILALLVERQGKIVTREELQKRLWPSDTFVDFEHSLNAAIKRLRDALDDSATTPRYIETLARRGYRFIPMGPVLPARSSHKTARWKTALPIAAVTIVAVAVTGGLVRHSREAHRLTDQDTIVLADFTNKTGESVFDDTPNQALAVQLEQSRFFNILSDERARETLRLLGRSPKERLSVELARDVCQRVGGKAVLSGSITNLGNLYVIGLTATGCASGEVLAREKGQAMRKEDVLKALDTAASSMRTKLGESLSSVRKFDLPTEQVTTPSLEALRAYILGRDARNQQEDLEASISHLRRAIELDPNFAMAQAALGLSYWSIGERRLAAQHAATAYQLRERVTERERFRIVEIYHMVVTDDLEQLKHNDEQWIQSYPQDQGPHGNLGDIHLHLGQYQECIREELVALGLNPNAAKVYENLGNCQLALDRFADAENTFKEGLRRGFDIYWLHQGLYDLAFLRGDFAGMQEQVAWSSGRPFAETQLLRSDSGSQAFYGHVTRARELARQAIAIARSHSLGGMAASLQGQEALWEAEFGNINRAREERSNVPTTRNWNLPTLLVLALARAGQTREAEAAVDKLVTGNPDDTFLKFYWLPTIRAAISLNRLQPARSIELLQLTIPYEMSFIPASGLVAGPLYPAYLRGEAYLRLGRGREAETEFQKFLEHRGIVVNSPTGALAHLQLGRAYAMSGDAAKAKAAYQDFLTLWKDADPDIPILKQAKIEYAKLQ